MTSREALERAGLQGEYVERAALTDGRKVSDALRGLSDMDRELFFAELGGAFCFACGSETDGICHCENDT